MKIKVGDYFYYNYDGDYSRFGDNVCYKGKIIGFKVTSRFKFFFKEKFLQIQWIKKHESSPEIEFVPLNYFPHFAISSQDK